MLIGELCKKLDISKHTIRHYEELGLIYADARKAGTRSYKNYRADTVERLEMIEEGKAFGLSLKQIKPLLDLFMENKLSESQSKQIVVDQLASVEKQIAGLEQIKARLKTKLATYGNPSTENC
ncbi:MerR family transcriptional regulator [Pseudoteredinibacter isoporae]|uniref:DNA-binding transcriptional MerR regulator n=1 Tax=Pseudoteredinibacter isoporae TaxID=570281 RepID=A0A7X0JW02_9GAMM|nr:MerR family transcriptional regulator [Pseudoteredinibacter isoporae]MBB6522306.1 DNA-binding transcriptional MerR regulator [Pseudoteredinibacter isoporae]NHO87839.1 MerR family transcriptional regulator [Pseudoteredinibacter isoporae]NIB23830.1 MerR family transcriptional regulator [Pseudoteredinibacter isoporae]